MNGDFYRVVQGGPGCPYLEYVDAERCPADVDVKDLPRCEDKCLEGDYCRGTGSGKERCGASDAKPQCDGEAVYRVTSTIDMAREGCDDGPDVDPGFEFDDDGDNCPFPCPARNEECPALEPLPADECPPKEASMADCVGYDCECGSVLKSTSRNASTRRLILHLSTGLGASP